MFTILYCQVININYLEFTYELRVCAKFSREHLSICKFDLVSRKCMKLKLLSSETVLLVQASSGVTRPISGNSNTPVQYPRANMYCRLCKLAHLQFGTRGTNSTVPTYNYADIGRWWLSWSGDERTSEIVAAAPICLAPTWHLHLLNLFV